MIDTNELRRLAQAATPGPDGISLSWITLLQDFQQGVSPAVINELLDRLEEAESDALEQARLSGMGASREAALMAKLEAAEKERDEFKRACFGHISDNSMLRAKITEMEKQEPVGTLHDDGCFVWRETAPHQSNYAGWKMALYALPGAKGEEK